MRRTPNEKNERIKRRFLEYRKHAKRLSEKSLDREIAALERFDVWNGRGDFAKFHIEQAMGFRSHLEEAKGATGKPLGKSTMRGILATLREFVLWLSQQDGFRSRIKAADADYFNLSRRDEAEARAAPARPAPSVNQAKCALAAMPSTTPRELRDKAVFALLCLTTAPMPFGICWPVTPSSHQTRSQSWSPTPRTSVTRMSSRPYEATVRSAANGKGSWLQESRVMNEASRGKTLIKVTE
ncbi:MAG: hypothetical protein AAGJ28_00340 [Pseudomonadota bacterium]